MTNPGQVVERRRRPAFDQLVKDERGCVSSARVGLWVVAVPLTLCAVVIDIGLTVIDAPARIPNTVYGLLGTMFLCFAGWAAGPRFAAQWGKAGEVAGALASAVRDRRLPSRHDDERFEDGR